MSIRRLNRREFLAASVAATAATCALSGVALAEVSRLSGRHKLGLTGAWQVAKKDSNEWLPAQVPGCIHTDLLAAGKIPDPYFGENERDVQWVGETDWVYRRKFEVTAQALNSARVLLRCEGLDTLATVKLNGSQLGQADNMFRAWEFDAKPLLKPGENEVEISLASPLPYMKKRQEERKLYEWIGSHEPAGRAYVRKEPCNFGWDWGPVLITCGIWRDISLVFLDDARLTEVLILQDHTLSGAVRLQLEAKAEIVKDVPLKARFTVGHGAGPTLTETSDVSNGTAKAELDIKDPQLWWPAGMGDQPLYQVAVELLDAKGTVVDRAARRIGLRTLKLLEPDEQHSLRFEANGIQFFAKGANWIPADAFANRVTPEILRRYVTGAVMANMNMLRFWGGGYYEDDALFEACNEMGICVWLDFKFGCSAYPAFDEAFMENVRQEAREQLRRLRHHSCIAVWCGNNEISLMTKDEWSDKSMGKADYDKLFKQLLGTEVKELAPQANYVSGSPDCGDVHNWQVWHGDKDFEAYRTLMGFMSEFGFQSFPESRTVSSYTKAEDRASVLTPVMQWHQRSSGNGNQRIQQTTLRYFKAPKDFENALWLSQLLQAYGVKMGAEHWRRTMPKSMGCLFWQYNDCWPVASWSSVDYYGRWKALQYFAKRFYAPLLVSALEEPGQNQVKLFVSSDRGETCCGKLSWEVTDPSGRRLLSSDLSVEIPSRACREVKTLELGDLVQQNGQEKLLVWLKLMVNDTVESENLVTLVRPKSIPLVAPQFKTAIRKAPEGFYVTVNAQHPALWCWLSLDDLDAHYSDNFVHVRPGQPAKILVTPARHMSEPEFTKALRVCSLFETSTT